MALRHLRVRFRAFAGHVVRPVVAAAAMAGGVTAVSAYGADVAWALAIQVATGAVVYAVVLLIAWLVAGRPDGPEADAVRALRRATFRHGEA
jgi:hypothetical protein